MAYVFVLLLVLLLEFTLGTDLEEQRRARLHEQSDNWGIEDYRIGVDSTLPAAQPKKKVRIVYISNSHAKTGGQIATHLQMLLDRIADEFKPDRANLV